MRDATKSILESVDGLDSIHSWEGLVDRDIAIELMAVIIDKIKSIEPEQAQGCMPIDGKQTFLDTLCWCNDSWGIMYRDRAGKSKFCWIRSGIAGTTEFERGKK